MQFGVLFAQLPLASVGTEACGGVITGDVLSPPSGHKVRTMAAEIVWPGTKSNKE